MSGSNSGRIVQTMSLSREEFQKSVVALDPGAVLSEQDHFRLCVPPGHVTIGFALLPSVRLGGLLELPCASVSVEFDGLSGPEREAFLRRFEIAFRRGGG